jgi:hypothetical protein
LLGSSQVNLWDGNQVPNTASSSIEASRSADLCLARLDLLGTYR